MRITTSRDMTSPIAPTSTIVDAYIAHRMVIEAVAEMKQRGLEPPVFRSANLPEGDAKNADHQALSFAHERFSKEKTRNTKHKT